MKKTILAVALSLSLTAGSVKAESISFNFSGHWTSVAAGLESWFTAGGNFYGVISYDTTISPVEALTHTDYTGSFPSKKTTLMSFTTNNWVGSVINPTIKISNDYLVTGAKTATDQFAIALPKGCLTLPLARPSFSYGSFSLVADSTGTSSAFADIGLPSVADMTSLAKMAKNRPFSLYFDDGNLNLMNVFGSIDSISPHPTPEPATLLLFATGLTGLAAYRRRRRNEK